ncbi:hypothetical protein TrST_g9767 [Triparma strigata]|uniref:Cyclin-dependent kinase 2 homolog n=1 Tax=Triparma strigata TaxID=1606541 RepID=A0A9W6ZPJ8_9STRA|nr:hypothetical protein TrST_g9767 [Triparma strigata]
MLFEFVKIDLSQILRSSPLNRLSPLWSHFGKEVTRGLLSGLAHVHSLGWVHRDIKPSNILVGNSGVKIADFGLARETGGGGVRGEGVGERGEFEGSGKVISLWYRCPEVLFNWNEPVLKYDCGVDVWSVGCIMGEFYLGRVMFEGRSEDSQINIMLGSWGRVRGDWARDAFKIFREGRFDYVEGELREGEADNVGGKWFDEGGKLSRACFPGLGEREEELLKGMLRYDRRKRLTSREAVLKYEGIWGHSRSLPSFNMDGVII